MVTIKATFIVFTISILTRFTLHYWGKQMCKLNMNFEKRTLTEVCGPCPHKPKNKWSTEYSVYPNQLPYNSHQ